MIKLSHYKDSIVNQLRSWRNLNKDWTLERAKNMAKIIADATCESVNSPTILELAKNPKLLHYEIKDTLLSDSDFTISNIAKIAFREYLLECAIAEYSDWEAN